MRSGLGWVAFCVYRYLQQYYLLLGDIMDNLTESDFDLILYMAGCSLAKVPGKQNWLEEDGVGGLPEYICRIAKGVMRSDSGKSVSAAISIAVGRVRTWARGGGGVNSDTRAKAAKAIAEWDAKRAKAKSNNKKVNLSNDITLNLANSYNIDDVRKQFKEQYTAPGTYTYVREMWSDHMIVSVEDEKSIEGGNKIYKVNYSVAKDGSVTFSDKVEMKMAYVPLSHADLETSLTDEQLVLAARIPCTEKEKVSLVDAVEKGKNLKAEAVLLSYAADKPALRKLIAGE
jgi:hypothetical protein